jgi:hypothetical protein
MGRQYSRAAKGFNDIDALDNVTKVKRRLVLRLVMISGTHIAKEKDKLPSCDTSTAATSTRRALDTSDSYLARLFSSFRVHPNGIIQQVRYDRLEHGVLHLQTDGRITG